MQESEKANDPYFDDESHLIDKNEVGGSKRKLLIWRILVFVLPVLVIVGAIAGTIIMGQFKPEPEEKEEAIKAIPVLTTAAETGDITLTVKAQGEVQPRTEISLAPQVSGQITYMSPKFIEGGKFKKGDLLVRIDPAEFELRVVQARALVTRAGNVVTREKSESDIARQDWEELGSTGKPSALTLREPQMAEAQANLESAKAQLAEAELLLARTSLYAPFNGRVTLRHIDQGEFVSAGTKLGEIYATNVMDVRLPLTNKDLREAGLSLGYEAQSGKGVPVTLSADIAGRYSSWAGHIVRTDSRFDNKTRVLYAYVEVKDPFGKGADNGTPLAPGLFVDAAVNGQQLDDVIFIPRGALRGEDQVYIANSDGSLSIKTVSVLSSSRDRAVIGSGLRIGEKVITSPIRGVADGMKIEEVKTGSSSDDSSDATLVSGEQP